MSLIKGCLVDDGHVLPLYDVYLKRCGQAHLLNLRSDTHFTGAMGDPYTGTFHTFLGSWIVSVSDFTVEDLMIAKRLWNDKVIVLLAILGLQYRRGWRLTDECREKAFLTWLFNDRHTELGRPLAGLKARVAFDVDDGIIDMRKGGRYSPTYTEGFLTRLVYNARVAATADINPDEHRISRNLALQDLHSDVDASLIREPLPPQPLSQFFGPGVGPNSEQLFTSGKVSEWKNYLKVKRDQYDLEKDANKPSSSTAQKMESQLQEVQQEKRKNCVAKARVKLQQKMEEDIGKRRFTFTQDSSEG